MAALLFPATGPLIIGSFLPSLAGILVGLLLALEYFVEKPPKFMDKRRFIWIGNALIYLKLPLGLVAFLLGVAHLLLADHVFL